jgi:hypothetical protein
MGLESLQGLFTSAKLSHDLSSHLNNNPLLNVPSSSSLSSSLNLTSSIPTSLSSSSYSYSSSLSDFTKRSSGSEAGSGFDPCRSLLENPIDGKFVIVNATAALDCYKYYTITQEQVFTLSLSLSLSLSLTLTPKISPSYLPQSHTIMNNCIRTEIGPH